MHKPAMQYGSPIGRDLARGQHVWCLLLEKLVESASPAVHDSCIITNLVLSQNTRKQLHQ